MRGARTSPRSVRTTPGSMAVTRVPSWIVTPCRSTARASPRTSRAGWIDAQCGEYVAPSTSVAPSRACASSADSSEKCSGPKPHERWSSISAIARSICTGVRMRATVPPLRKWQSTPSASATLPTSSTVSNIASISDTAASRDDDAATFDIAVGNSAEAQPPLRPLAPKPAVSASSTTMRSDGSAFAR